MTLNKAIEYGKERREQYRKSKQFDSTCRNRGSCPWCYRNRTIRWRSKRKVADEAIRKYYEEQSNGIQ